MLLAVIVLSCDTADGDMVTLGGSVKPWLLYLKKGHHLLARIEVQHFFAFLFPFSLWQVRKMKMISLVWRCCRAGCGDRDCPPTSARCRLCGWMPCGCWCVRLSACRWLQVCKCTVGNSPWGWLLWKGEILLMLYLHQGLGDFEEVVLLHHSGSFGFCLTSLTAISLHTASGYKGLAAKTAFSGCFHTVLSFNGSFLQSYISEW